MVGDWVCLDGDINYDSPIRIRQIGYQGENDIVADNDIFGVEDIIPIPLTEEILTKNGFLKRSGKEYYLKDDIVIFVGSDSCEVCTLYGEYTAYSYVEEGYTTIATIHYIHQLQHLLRLAGVQKEIEL